MVYNQLDYLNVKECMKKDSLSTNYLVCLEINTSIDNLQAFK